MRPTPLRPLFAALAGVLLVNSAFAQTAAVAQPPAGADDHLAMGKMWTFENPPLAYLEQEYGFKPDQNWLDSLRLSSLRLGERDNPWCSAAFVSPQGLVMTNHHCVRDAVATLGESMGNPGLVDAGYAAKALTDEVKLEGLTVQQLVQQQDITQKVNEGVAPGGDATEIGRLRDANIAAIQKAAATAHPELLHQVVTLYQGAVYQLYSYKVYDDIRLVMAVNLQTAHFGGDPDNFTYPRWSIDFSFVRAWEGDKPADTTSHYFKWRKFGVQDNELVFVPGNPGSTNRLFTKAQLEYQRDVEYPIIVEQLQNGMRIVAPFAEDNAGLRTTLLGWENSYKSIKGTMDGLRDAELMATKRGHEERFLQRVQTDPALSKDYGDAWTAMAEQVQTKRAVHPKAAFYSASYSAILERAIGIAKAVDATIDDDKRTAAREEVLASKMYGNPLTNRLLMDHCKRAEKWLGKDDPFVTAVAGAHRSDNGVDWVQALTDLTKSNLRKDAFVKELLEGGVDAVAACDDLGMKIGRVLWPLMRDAEEEERVVDYAIAVHGARLGRALHAVFGTKVSPDATMTLRFSDGRVKGYDYNGTIAPWSTSFYGLYGRNVEFADAFPFTLAQPWKDAKDKIDLQKRVCFVSTNDIVGGNSGSSIVDKDLQVVGLIFDGNIESLPNDFYYTQNKARAVSVHTDAIVEALDKVYGMSRITSELMPASSGK